MRIIATLILLVLSTSCTESDKAAAKNSETISSRQEMVVYKSPTCGCCTKWADHMRENGFLLVEKPIDNLTEKKDSLGVPKDKRSCHTAVLGDYVFEGHIPAASIKKFLKENRDAKGLAVPDMPMGSPGMDYGQHKAKFNVYSFDRNGRSEVFDIY